MIRISRRGAAAGFSMLAIGAVAVAASIGGAAAHPTTTSTASALPRGETLYTTGTMWGTYSDLNPFKTWDYVTGLVGLVYEPLFNYDPLTDKFTPWLATKGTWVKKNVYRATVRPGVTWSDGKPSPRRMSSSRSRPARSPRRRSISCGRAASRTSRRRATT